MITFLLPSLKWEGSQLTLAVVSSKAVKFLVVAFPPITTSIISPAAISSLILAKNPAASTFSTTT